jgi:hypothetical protein
MENMETGKASSGAGSFRIVPNPKLKLLEQVREVCRLKHFSLRTEDCYAGWIRRFLRHHRELTGTWRHPCEMGGGSSRPS